jgi:hypothetical protein
MQRRKQQLPKEINVGQVVTKAEYTFASRWSSNALEHSSNKTCWTCKKYKNFIDTWIKSFTATFKHKPKLVLLTKRGQLPQAAFRQERVYWTSPDARCRVSGMSPSNRVHTNDPCLPFPMQKLQHSVFPRGCHRSSNHPLLPGITNYLSRIPNNRKIKVV